MKQQPTPSVAAVLIARNEAARLPAALASVAWADERIVVVDAATTDATEEVAIACGARAVRHPFTNYAAQRNFGDTLTTCDWIFCLDADERATPTLGAAVRRAIAAPGPYVAFTVRRRNRYLGRWVRYGGWYPDRQLRLYRRGAGQWRGEFVHESFEPTGPTGRLDGEIEHEAINSLAEHQAKTNRYTDLAAQELRVGGRRIPLWKLLLWPPATFFKTYVIQLGCLDGFAGLCIAWFAAHYVFLKYAKARLPGD
ncbi:MAG: glycosyltransferase family 2 protein [Chloracidobacterium sp.]|nr:glycosyltransferase family 2 protein [Chloracidobacterium sp.]